MTLRRFIAAWIAVSVFLHPSLVSVTHAQVESVSVETRIAANAASSVSNLGIIGGAGASITNSLSSRPAGSGSMAVFSPLSGVSPHVSEPISSILSAGAARSADSAQSGERLSLAETAFRFPTDVAGDAIGLGGRRSAEELSQVDAAPVSEDRLPSGVRSVTAEFAREPEDIDRLIPFGDGSYNLQIDHVLINELEKAVLSYGELRILTYTDAIGNHFVGLDLRQDPRWLDHIPEIEDGEKKTVRKILTHNADVQIILREHGKTPDLVVAGVVTELKSRMKKGYPTYAELRNANTQVTDFNGRHRISGGGDLVVDLTKDDSIPVGEIKRKLNAWARSSDLAPQLRRIWVFAGDDLKAFALQSDGSYEPVDGEPWGRPSLAAQPTDFSGNHAAWKSPGRGPFRSAQEILRDLRDGEGPEYDHRTLLTRANEQLRAQRELRRIQKIVGRGSSAAARRNWENFRRTHSAEAAGLIAVDVEKILSPAGPARSGDSSGVAPEALSLPESVDIPIPSRAGMDRFVKELEEPPMMLRRGGIRATVAVFGSARILSGDEARAAYEAAPTKKNFQALADSKYYEMTRRLGRLIAVRGRGLLAVVTGGGPGIMEAGNRGAFEAGGPSVGYNIALEHEQRLNPYVTPGLSYEFQNFETRIKNLIYGAAALVFSSGGFGTNEEIFTALTHMQTGKIPRVPIIVLGDRDYWDRLQVLVMNMMDRNFVSKPDLSLLQFAKDEERAWSIIEKSLRELSALSPQSGVPAIPQPVSK